ncbi:MAG: diguanylate cyclase [Myxococcaceae bacterium]|nr:diguanylate cyclase [Myxococcaceae bacterium]
MRAVLESRFFHEAPLLLCLAEGGRFTSLSGAWEKTLGWTVAEFLAAPALAFVHPDDVAATTSEIDRVSRGEPIIRFVNRYRRKDGAWVTLQWDALPGGSGDGAVFAIAQDVTETRHRDQALARRTVVLEALAELQRGFIELGLSPALLHALVKRLVRLTDSALGFIVTVQPRDPKRPTVEVRGWAAADDVAATMPPVLAALDAPYLAAMAAVEPLTLAFPDDAPLSTELPVPVHTLLAIPLSAGPAFAGALVLVNRRGGYDAGCTTVLEPLVRALSSLFLLQERRVHAATLEGEVQRLTDVSTVVFESIDASIITTDTTGAIRSMNPVAVRMLGAAALEHATNLASFHEAVELSARAARADDVLGTLTPFEQLTAPARAAGGSDRREWTYVSLSGVRYAMQVTMRALRDRQGQLAGWVAIGTELTSARQAVQARERITALEAELALLRRRMDETTRISEAATYVAASRSVREALGVIGALLPSMVAGAAPRLLITRGGQRADAPRPEGLPQGCFGVELSACWAATTGQLFVSTRDGVRCGHLAGEAGEWVCAPLGDSTRVVAVLSAALPAEQARPGVRDAALAAVRDEARHLSTVLANLQLRHELEEQALRDPLTGTVNRRHLERELSGALRQLARGGPPFALVMFDVDHFKHINDTHGHDAGDAVLTELAARLRARLRATDLLARVGGEEFMVVLREVGPSAAAKVAEALRAVVEGTPVAAGRVRCTCSFGVTVVAAEEAALPLEVHWRRADLALYEAKRSGRNAVRTWAPDLGAGARP